MDVIVVGLGGLGSAAAYWASKRASVVGLEQFELGHGRGASEDHSRIVRLSYHTPGYVRMAQQAYGAWAALEAEAGPLIVRTGGLDLGPRDGAIPLEDYAKSMRACDVAFEELDAGDIMRRWPQWRLGDDVRGLFQEDGGIAPAARCNEAHRRLATEHGARLVEHAPATAIRVAGGAVVVEAGGRTYEGDRVILTADAWTNRLLAPLGRTLPLTVTKEQVVYFDAPGFTDFPVWIWMDDPSFYGTPAFGEPGPKAGQDCGGPVVDDPDDRTFDPDPVAAQRLREFVAAHLPTADRPALLVKTCLYTLTPDRDFVIDALPEHPEVLVALGGGHAFKFASLIGRALTELALGGRTDVDLAPFRIDRPILTETDPPARWLV